MVTAAGAPLVTPLKAELRCFQAGRYCVDVSRNGRAKYVNRPYSLVPRACCSGNPLSSSAGDRLCGGGGVGSRNSGDGELPRPRACAPLLCDSEDTRLGNGASEFSGAKDYHIGSSNGLPCPELSQKIVVAVDIDEVLGNFVSAISQFIAERYSLHQAVSEYHVYEFAKIWRCSKDEANIRVHEFFESSYFKTAIHPIPGARQAIRNLSKVCNMSIVTSRQYAIQDHTIEWINKHYPDLFQEIYFGNHFALNGKSIPKSEICRGKRKSVYSKLLVKGRSIHNVKSSKISQKAMCVGRPYPYLEVQRLFLGNLFGSNTEAHTKSLGAKVLIDDNPGYAIECAEAGIKVLLFDYENSYPWSKTEFVNGHPLITRVHNWEEVELHLASWIFPTGNTTSSNFVKEQFL
ncbi:hypothetical protein DM860_014280 [Cuscuta australis]|uniref:Uncharacterized protein n=1 Tax=Cuscuta australis TaxID=267555 RepID=A0A328DHN4_9ASTE|nr:hypothetical protein DM860_014280 [Cuscuta australis]